MAGCRAPMPEGSPYQRTLGGVRDREGGRVGVTPGRVLPRGGGNPLQVKRAKQLGNSWRRGGRGSLCGVDPSTGQAAKACLYRLRAVSSQRCLSTRPAGNYTGGEESTSAGRRKRPWDRGLREGVMHTARCRMPVAYCRDPYPSVRPSGTEGRGDLPKARAQPLGVAPVCSTGHGHYHGGIRTCVFRAGSRANGTPGLTGL